jgi:Mn-dependent DtxR family transcriptional regulator
MQPRPREVRWLPQKGRLVTPMDRKLAFAAIREFIQNNPGCTRAEFSDQLLIGAEEAALVDELIARGLVEERRGRRVRLYARTAEAARTYLADARYNRLGRRLRLHIADRDLREAGSMLDDLDADVRSMVVEKCDEYARKHRR